MSYYAEQERTLEAIEDETCPICHASVCLHQESVITDEKRIAHAECLKEDA